MTGRNMCEVRGPKCNIDGHIIGHMQDKTQYQGYRHCIDKFSGKINVGGY